MFSSLAKMTDETSYWEATHRCMRQAAHADDVPSIGLVEGISGLRAVAALLDKERPEYRRLIDQCDTYVESELPDPETVTLCSFQDFDIISGWSGARLARCVTAPSPDDKLVDLLIWLLGDDTRWYLVHPALPDRPPENDIGVAHGIAGVMATLALTADMSDDLHRTFLRGQALKLISYSLREGGRVLWPSSTQGTLKVDQRGWCYGTPGTAAALLWTGRALSDDAITAFALDALEAEGSQPVEAWNFWDRALCHGALGCALIYASVGHASRCQALGRFVEPLVQLSLDDLEANEMAHLGVRPDTREHVLLSQLDGSAGMAMALLTLADQIPADWVRLHGLVPWKRQGACQPAGRIG
ncbi:MAG: hypothetical protein JOZ77_08085 [Candidatus Eremiobacteraeota bacterium]|nr:hypothetical protein [Candidatus Eremiobacteraeota bacterium]